MSKVNGWGKWGFPGTKLSAGSKHRFRWQLPPAANKQLYELPGGQLTDEDGTTGAIGRCPREHIGAVQAGQPDKFVSKVSRHLPLGVGRETAGSFSMAVAVAIVPTFCSGVILVCVPQLGPGINPKQCLESCQQSIGFCVGTKVVFLRLSNLCAITLRARLRKAMSAKRSYSSISGI